MASSTHKAAAQMAQPTRAELIAFLAACENDLDLAQGKTTDNGTLMQIGAAQFALNGRRLLELARAGVDGITDA